MPVPTQRLSGDRRVLDLATVRDLDEALLLAEATGHRLLWLYRGREGGVRLVLTPRA